MGANDQFSRVSTRFCVSSCITPYFLYFSARAEKSQVRERGPTALFYFIGLGGRSGQGPLAAGHRAPETPQNHTKDIPVGPDLSTVIALYVTERQPGGNCRVGEALPRFAKEDTL